MRSNVVRAIFCVVFVLAFAPTAALADDALVGTWKITITPDEDARKAGEKKDIEDKITLKGSKFVSQRWQKDHKFEPVAYEEDTRRGPIAKFTAKPESKTGGKMEWTGQVTGSVIKGEITWTKKDGTVLKYAYEGEKSQ
jgi:hypothetical protein